MFVCFLAKLFSTSSTSLKWRLLNRSPPPCPTNGTAAKARGFAPAIALVAPDAYCCFLVFYSGEKQPKKRALGEGGTGVGKFRVAFTAGRLVARL